MRLTDSYAKAILTVIAAFFLWLTLKSFAPQLVKAGKEQAGGVELIKIGGNYIFSPILLKRSKERRGVDYSALAEEVFRFRDNLWLFLVKSLRGRRAKRIKKKRLTNLTKYKVKLRCSQLVKTFTVIGLAELQLKKYSQSDC